MMRLGSAVVAVAALVGCGPGVGGTVTDADTSDPCVSDGDPPFNLCSYGFGVARSDTVGEVAPVRIELELSPELAGDVVDLGLELTAYTGQALPGVVLTLSTEQGSVLQTAPLTGPHDNEADLAADLDVRTCPVGEACTFVLRIDAPPTDAAVPVPVEVEGRVVAQVQSRAAVSEDPLPTLRVLAAEATP